MLRSAALQAVRARFRATRASAVPQQALWALHEAPEGLRSSSSSPGLTHVGPDGLPTMVDVSAKTPTRRTATAQCSVRLPPVVAMQLRDGEIASKKGPVFATAIISGTMGAKQTSSLIPFCHPLGLESCRLEISPDPAGADPDGFTPILIKCTVGVTAKTGVEMEALTGCTIAALTIYDMCKALSHDIQISGICLVHKTGGKSDVKPQG